MTALHQAVMAGNELVVSHIPRPFLPSERVASIMERLKLVVELLLARGADPDAGSDDMPHPIDACRLAGRA